MKYVLLLFTGLVLMSCGISRSNGHLRKVKVDRILKKVEAKEPRICYWHAILTEDAVISEEASVDKVIDEYEFVSVQSSTKVEDAVAISEDNIETKRSGTEMIVSVNLPEVNSDKVSGSHRKKSGRVSGVRQNQGA